MIYTFYSYKGGVGRSMAMANVAEYLYRQGLRVVIIDWDLEAPGIENFYFSSTEKEGQEKLKSVRSQLGIVDLLESYKRQFPFITWPEQQTRSDASGESKGQTEGSVKTDVQAQIDEQIAFLQKVVPPLKHHLYAIHEPGTSKEYPQAALWLLPAGWREEERFAAYSQAVQRFDWPDFYVNFRGKVFFEWLRQELEKQADVILVDSRTGVTEMGGVCTRQLADVVVSLSVLNNQNMEGVAKMSKSFKLPEVIDARDGRPIESIVVPTRIDSGEIDIRARLIDEFEKIMGDVPRAFMQAKTSYWNLNIPYVGKYAYFEKLAIGSDDKAYELQDAYMRLAAHLALLAPEESALRERFQEELGRRFRFSESRVLSMAPPLPDSFVDRPGETSKVVSGLLTSDGESRVGTCVVLCGPAGAGKSSIAIAVANDKKVIAAFKDGILWVTLGVSPDLLEVLKKLYKAVTGESRTFNNKDEAVRYLDDALRGRNCLMVIDDVWTDDYLLFLNIGNRCARLLTTRDPNLAGKVNSKPIFIGSLTPDQAVEVVAEQAGLSPDERSGLAEITGRLGRMPLTLKLAGEALRVWLAQSSPSLALSTLSHALDEGGVIAFDQPDASERNQSVADSIAASLDLLKENELELYAQLLLSINGTEVSLQRLSELWQLDLIKTEYNAQRLQALSLLEYQAEEKRVILPGAELRSTLLSRLPHSVGLDVRAENFYSSLSPEQQAVAQRVFTRLVRLAQPDEAASDTRARVRLKDLDAPAQQLVDSLSGAQIITQETNQLTGEQSVQLADEGVIQKWGRLREWIDNDRKFLLWRQQLRAAIEEWNDSLHHQGALLRGLSLSVAKNWKKERGQELEEIEARFINESIRFQWRQKLYWVLGIILIVILLTSLIYLFMRWQASEQQRLSSEERRKEAEQRSSPAEREALAHYNNGLSAGQRNDQDTAIAEFTQAIALFPNWRELYNNRGSAYLNKESYDAAVADFNTAIQLDPSYAEAYYNRGLTYMRMGELDKATADFQRVLELPASQRIIDAARQALQNIRSPQPTPAATTSASYAPLVYLQYGDKADLATLNVVQGTLKSAGYNAPGIEYVGKPFPPEVRYFYAEDKDSADAIRTLVMNSLKRAGASLDLKLTRINNPGNARRGQIEVWVPSLSGGSAPSGNSTKK